MAQEIVGIKIVVDGQEKILSSMKEVRQELKKAQQDVLLFSETFGSTSKQAVEAAKRVAQLKDSIGDAKAMSDGFNPDAKFKAFGAALQGVVGAFSAVQGAMGLFGVKNEEVEKTLLKVQSAMALSQGIDSVLESVDAFKNLGARIGIVSGIQKIYAVTTGLVSSALRLVGINATTASVGVRTFSTALLATGIGAIVVGLGFLASEFMSVGNAADDAADKAKKLKEQLEGIDDAIKGSQGYADRQIRLIKNEERLKNLQLDSNANQVEIEKTRKAILNDKLTGINVELEAKKGLLSTEDQLRLKSEQYRTEQELVRIDLEKTAKATQATREQQKKNADKALADAETLRQKQVKDQEERVQGNAKADSDIRLAKQENFLLTIKDENERSKKKLDFDLQNRILEIEALNVDESKKRDLKLEAAISTQNALDILDIEIKNKQAEKDKAFAETQAKKLESTLQLAKERQDAIRIATSTDEENELFDLSAKYAKRFELVKGNAEAEAALVKEYENIKKNLRIAAINNELSNYATAAGSISQLLGQSTAAGKAFAIAEATINTYKAASQVFAAPVPGIAPVSLGIKIATMVAAIASGIKNVKSIVATKAPGVPSGSMPQVPSISSMAPMAPQTPQAMLTQLDQRSINQLGSATNRSYVVESDVTNSQERIRRINRAARLN